MNSNLEKLHDRSLNYSNSYNIICVTETGSADNIPFNKPRFYTSRKKNWQKSRWHSNIIK